MFTWSDFTKPCKPCGFCYQVQILALFLTEVIGTVITLWQGSDYQHRFSMLMPVPALKKLHPIWRRGVGKGRDWCKWSIHLVYFDDTACWCVVT